MEQTKCLQKYFIEDNVKNGRVICVNGKKGSGKSHLITNYLAYAINHNIYDKVFCVIPEFKHDNNDDTYKFLESQNNVYIYEKYTPLLLEHVKKETEKYRTCVFLDDATNYLFKNKEEQLLKLASTSRHGKGCTFIMILHSLSNIIAPAIRALIDHIFIGRFNNAKTLKHIWEENLSIFMDYKTFTHMYMEKIIKEEYNFIYLNSKNEFDINVNQWSLGKYDKNKVFSNGKCKILLIDDEKQNITKKILKQKRTQEIKDEIIPKNRSSKKSFLFL